MSSDLKIWQQVPDFKMKTDGDGEITLSDLKGWRDVLYSYPKDDASGCTKEAIGCTEQLPAIQMLDAVVNGASPDSVAKHDTFKAKHELGIMLASDESKEVCDRYGIWVEKSMYGLQVHGRRTVDILDRYKGQGCPDLAQGESAGSYRPSVRSDTGAAMTGRGDVSA